MASRVPSASTRKKAQVILTCQLCQRNSLLKWKCMDCDILMCENCKINVHSKVKTAKIHNIVDIKDVDFSQPKEQSVDLDNIPCKTHPTQLCCVYCIQCKELICPKCLKTHKGHDIEEIETQYIKNLEYLQTNISGNIDPYDFHVIFESFDKLCKITDPKYIQLTPIKTYETNLPFVAKLVTTSVNTLWTSCFKTTTLQEMDIAEELTPIREYIDQDVYDMEISKAGDVLFTITDDTNLYRLRKTGHINSLHDFGPLIPKAILVTDDSIIVTTREKGDAWPLTEQSRRQIVVLGQTGEQKIKVIEYDRQNKRLMCLIMRIAMDKTKNIVGIDLLSANTGRVVKFDNMSIKWIYDGDINTKACPFYPTDLTITQLGNIIVADNTTDTLHILSEEGVLIKCCKIKTTPIYPSNITITQLEKYIIRSIDIISPFSLDIDSNGYLWVGCNTCKFRAENAKIYKLEITGC